MTAALCPSSGTKGKKVGAVTLHALVRNEFPIADDAEYYFCDAKVLAVAFLFFPNYLKFFLTGGETKEPATNNPLVRTTAFAVEGMTCEGCAALVVKAVKAVPGVLSVKVDYDRKRAAVTSEACCKTPVDAILQALDKVGYRGEVVEDTPAQEGH
jgi:copper chaperone CopZ